MITAKYSSALILSDPTIFDLHGKRLLNQLTLPSELFLAPEGEAGKNLEVAKSCWEKMAIMGMDPQSVIITLGGGSICDLGGFIASTYMRGISLIHHPTTLLAMVDASIGGKSALNFAGEKNLIGTLHLPEEILIDLTVLKTLDEAEIRAGFAEVIKMGMLADPDLLLLDDLQEIVKRCIRLKKEFCANGKRYLLNWGHTFAHAIEGLLNYQIRHGEAVAIGMRCAAHLSLSLGFTDKTLIERQNEALYKRGLLLDLPNLSGKQIVEKMRRDKKGAHGKINCILSRGIGKMELVEGVDPKIIEEVWESLRFSDLKDNHSQEYGNGLSEQLALQE